MYRTSMKLMSAVLIAVALDGSAAFAQGTIAQQDACRPDVFRLCSSYIPDVGEIVACLRSNKGRLSEACQQVMFADHAETEGYARPSRLRSDRDQ
jgi:hypothetical protein